jgi:nucleoside-diphosphate-sugar epimerase
VTTTRIDWPEGHYLITGGAGFIGSNLAESILEAGRPVRVVDSFITGRRENLAGLDVELIEGDLRDIEVCRTAAKDVTWILHEAALGSVPRSVDDPLTTNSHNVTGTLNVLAAAKDAGVRRVVLAASSSAYGDTPVLPKVESMPSEPLSPYAVSKLVGELYAKVFNRVYGLETISLRYFNVFGRRQDPEGMYAAVIPKFIKLLLAGKQPEIHGDGEQSRDFSYIDNVLSVNRLALTAPAAALGQTINVAYGDRISLNQLYAKLEDLLDIHIAPRYVAARAGDVKHSQADITKARTLLGYEPLVDAFTGLERTIDWYTENLR